MDILPIQGSAVPCERVFSSAKETMTLRRNCISAPLMQALQILKFALQHKIGKGLNFTAGTSLDDEILWMEKMTLRQFEAPSEIEEFRSLLIAND